MQLNTISLAGIGIAKLVELDATQSVATSVYSFPSVSESIFSIVKKNAILFKHYK